MNSLLKFSFSFLSFSIFFPLIVYFKISRKLACIFFVLLFSISFITFINKKFLQNLKIFLEKTGVFLGEKLAICALFFVFIFAIIPTKFIMFLTKRDRLKLKDSNDLSFWTDYKTNESVDYEAQF